MAENGIRLLAKGQERSNDTWVTGINNNDLVIGPSGAGKAAMLELLLFGHRPLALPDLQDENGKYSEEKALAAAGLLTEKLSLREQRRQPNQPGPEEKCLTSFFYCALRLSASRPAWIPALQGNLQDLLRCANCMEYTQKHELIFCELTPNAPEGEGNFFLWMDEAYDLLCGTPITRTIGTIDRQIMEEQYREAFGVMEESFFDSDEDEDLARFDRMQQEKDKTAALRAYRGSDALRQKSAWASAFPQPRAFCSHYLTFRELYFTGDLPQRLPQLVKQALDRYTAENACPLYLDDAAFSSVCGLLDNAAGQLQRYLKKEN